MKRQFKYIRLKQGSKEWEQWRHENGFGGSDIASVLSTNSKELAELVYTPPIKLFLERIGEPVQKFTGNVASESGKFFEPIILEYYKHYDFESPDQMAMFRNIQAKRPVNGLWRPNGIIQNPKWPWLYYSPDGFGTESLKSKKPCVVLESKQTTSFETKRYKNGLNPAHYLQCMAGLMITGFDKGYVLSLVDGQWFEPTIILPDKEIFQWIEQISAEFWTRVVKARMIKIEYGLGAYFNVNPDTLTEKQREGVERISELEPSLIGSNNEIKTICEMVIPAPEKTEREGTQDEWVLCQKYNQACAKISDAEAEKNEAYGSLLLSLSGANYVKFDDGKAGYYSYMSDKNGKRSIRVSLK
jgi:hypothetical protein